MTTPAEAHISSRFVSSNENAVLEELLMRLKANLTTPDGRHTGFLEESEFNARMIDSSCGN